MSDTTERVIPSSITVTICGKEREVFMSFNRLNRLTYIVGKIENLPTVMLNPEVRMAVLRDLAQERDDKGKVITDYSEEELDMSQDDALNLLDFAQEHIMDFFMKAAAKANHLVQSQQARFALLNLTPIPTGPAR